MRIALAIPLALLPALAAAQIPVLSVTPSALVFVAGTGQGQSVPQQVHVGNRGSGTLRWRATADAGWVRVSPASGTGAADLTVTADPARLQAGKHEARIRIEAADADDSPATVTVTAQVGVARAAAPPHAAAKIPLTATAGAKAPATWTFQLDGPGDAPTAWRLSSDAPWLTADPAVGHDADTRHHQSRREPARGRRLPGLGAVLQRGGGTAADRPGLLHGRCGSRRHGGDGAPNRPPRPPRPGSRRR